MSQSQFQAFFENLLIYGLEYFRKFYGVYRGFVVDNKDPEQRGRIKVFVPEVGHRKDSPPNVWVEPAFDGAGDKVGMFWPPEIHDEKNKKPSTVRVAFAFGDPSKPTVYWGGWFGDKRVPEKFKYDATKAPAVRGLRTKSGHTLLFNDEKGKESVELYWKDETAFLKFDETGAITLATGQSFVIIDKKQKYLMMQDENGSYVMLDKDGISLSSAKDVMIEGQNITLKGAHVYTDSPKVEIDKNGTQGIPRGVDLLTWINAHNHQTSVGPTSPPISPALPALLSAKAKVD